MESQLVTHHTIPPVYRTDSRVLILGTIPSPKSREYGFYYSHPQNKFWRVLAALFNEEIPQTNAQKEQLAVSHHIALWDVLQECEIKGAQDSSIKNPVPNELRTLFDASPIQAVFTTGLTATKLYQKHCLPITGRQSSYLPSTSPANCRNYSFEKLVEAYQVILPYL